MLIAVITAVALVLWGVAVSGGAGQFWTSGATEAGGHGEITDAERENLQDVLESIDRDDGRAE